MFAFVTLILSDSYLPGALALCASLLDVHVPESELELSAGQREAAAVDAKGDIQKAAHVSTETSTDTMSYGNSASAAVRQTFETVCMVTTDNVTHETLISLRHAFDLVVGVETIKGDTENLEVLGRPDLHSVLTKLHVFRLTRYEKIVFLDADTLVLRPIDHLFHLGPGFFAVPDAGWPDCFNSGVMVLSPSTETFDGIVAMARDKGSFDGGDQGILNDYFPDWQRLSFTYNTTPTPAYTYEPAYRRHGNSIHIVHFIGQNKPWLAQRPRDVPASSESATSYHTLVKAWYAVYDSHYPGLNTETSITTPFEVPQLSAAWTTKDRKHEKRMDLDDLKKVFMRGARKSAFEVGSWSDQSLNFITLHGAPNLSKSALERDNLESVADTTYNEEEWSFCSDGTHQMKHNFENSINASWGRGWDPHSLFTPPKNPPMPDSAHHSHDYDGSMRSTSRTSWSNHRRPTRLFPGEEPRSRQSRAHSTASNSPMGESFHSPAVYQNAWDQVPAINAWAAGYGRPGSRSQHSGQRPRSRSRSKSATRRTGSGSSGNGQDGDDEGEAGEPSVANHHDQANRRPSVTKLSVETDNDVVRRDSPAVTPALTPSMTPSNSTTTQEDDSMASIPSTHGRNGSVSSAPLGQISHNSGGRVFAEETNPEILKTGRQQTMERLVRASMNNLKSTATQ